MGTTSLCCARRRTAARYLEQLAGSYHRFYDACRVLPRDPAADDPAPELTRARL